MREINESYKDGYKEGWKDCKEEIRRHIISIRHQPFSLFGRPPDVYSADLLSEMEGLDTLSIMRKEADHAEK